MMQKRHSRSALALCLLMTSGCAGRVNVSPECVIERPNADVLNEQIGEALMKKATGSAQLPATHEWIKRLDHDIDLFGDGK